MRINEIFLSLQGEGIYQNLPTVFVRLQGCNLLPDFCSFCDTSYAQDAQGGKELDASEVVKEVKELLPPYNWVCITGGEPLWQLEGLEALVRRLKEGHYLIEIETNGSFPPPSWYTLVDSWNADVKCPGSGVCGVFDYRWLKTRICDQLKFVVGTDEDLLFAEKFLDYHGWQTNPTVLVSPVVNTDALGKPIIEMERWQRVWSFCVEKRIRWSFQQHKLVWGSKKGV